MSIQKIDAHISSINEVPIRSEETNETSYRTKVENFLRAIKTFSKELITLISQLNRFSRETNSTKDTLNSWRDEVLANKNKTFAYSQDALNAKNYVQNYMMVYGDAYRPEVVDEMLSSVLEKLVAFEIKDGILKSSIEQVIANFLEEKEKNQKINRRQDENIKEIENTIVHNENRILELLVAQQAQISILKQ